MASTIFSSCSSSTSTARLPKFNTIRRSGSVRLRPPPAFLSFKPPSPAGFGASSISMQRRSSNSSITAVAMSMSTRFPRVKLNGKAVAEEIRDEITDEVTRMRDAIGVTPKLTVIVVGDKNHSPDHLANKLEACEAAGIKTDVIRLLDDSSEEEVLDCISRFNDESSVHGIHIQLPLPLHMDNQKILNAVRVEKDVDGFSSLKTRDQQPPFKFPSVIPCTAKGCMELLYRCDIRIKGKSVVVIGNGTDTDIVAPAAAYLLQRHGANVTVVHRGTENLKEIIGEADILISAAERAYLVRARWIKPRAIVIDTGNNMMKSHLGSYEFVGDVCYEEPYEWASVIAPVPGGVESMTTAMLLSNTLLMAKRALKFE
ncbi:bifunctional protein FolD 4, chloroplastic-like [Papaver somniferum]|uniref:bifunctional protein FolD 4, chloroplastic-like n=1 Tax=Papaver somniferum TaxID=3469 RepID=UPI000E6F6847|nr:bifunctional protein FolD 4, chloroplastic-like [Papaver somniferum]